VAGKYELTRQAVMRLHTLNTSNATLTVQEAIGLQFTPDNYSHFSMEFSVNVLVAADLSRFADKVRDTKASPLVADQIVDVVRRLIEWSEEQPDLEFDASTQRDQATVKYKVSLNGALLWSAYPRVADAAKIELLARTSDWPNASTRDWLAQSLISFGGPRNWQPGETFMIPALELADPAQFSKFTDLLETLSRSA
jgi:hypothetical protein